MPVTVDGRIDLDALAREAWARGFSMVSASPLTRSSYHAEEDFARLRARSAPAAAGR